MEYNTIIISFRNKHINYLNNNKEKLRLKTE